MTVAASAAAKTAISSAARPTLRSKAATTHRLGRAAWPSCRGHRANGNKNEPGPHGLRGSRRRERAMSDALNKGSAMFLSDFGKRASACTAAAGARCWPAACPLGFAVIQQPANPHRHRFNLKHRAQRKPWQWQHRSLPQATYAARYARPAQPQCGAMQRNRSACRLQCPTGHAASGTAAAAGAGSTAGATATPSKRL